MELQLERMRNSIFARASRIQKETERAVSMGYLKVLLVAVSAVFLGRAAVFYEMFPCGIALITVLMHKGRANIYALPLILAGLLTNIGTGYDLWGDAITVLICGIFFFLTVKMDMGIAVKAFCSAGILVLTKSIYCLLSEMVFIYDIFMMFVEGLVILGLVFLFHKFYGLFERKRKACTSTAEGIIATSGVFTLVLGGVGIDMLGVFTPVLIGALLMTILSGYKIGVLEGGASGIASGLAAMLMTAGSPAMIGIFACAGMTAGFFKGLNRLTAGICFAAVCISFSLVKGYPELYLSIYDPLVAALIFVLLPERWLGKMELALAKIRKDHIYQEMAARDRMLLTLSGYQETFEKLSGLFSMSQNRSSVIASQFLGMKRAVEKMTEELTMSEPVLVPQKPKYGIKVGVSGYAKERRVSGDSYLCADLRDGDFMIALSDGMGKGEAASRESALTITSLFHLMKAGFDVELALKTINSLLLYQSTEEIFSTVDLGLFNKMTGKMRFFKIGAAATFVKRGDKVETIKVSALPMGIVDKVRVNHIELQGKKGDEIIIVSDGITEADRADGELEWIRETISQIRSRDPQTMSDLLINKAVERYGLKEKDDMTVITAIIN